MALNLAYCLPENCSWEEVPELKGKTVYSLVMVRGTVYAGTAAGVYASTDGLSWKSTVLRLPTYALLTLGDGKILAGTADGVYLSSDEGRTWVEAGLKGLEVYALAFSKDVVYAGTGRGVYKSSPATGSWEAGSLREPVSSLAADPADPQVIYAGTWGFLAELGDVYVSRDGGLSWTRAWFSNYTRASLAEATAGAMIVLPLDYSVTCVLINPCDSNRVYACVKYAFIWFLTFPQVGGGLEFSLDSGVSWKIGPYLPGVSSAVFETGCRSLLVGTDNGVYRVIDADGFPSEGLGPGNTSIRAMAVDSDRWRIYAGTTNGLLVLQTSTAELNLSRPSRVPMGAATLRLNGAISGAGEGLAGKRLYVLVNGEGVGFCETDSQGSFDCVIPCIIQGKDAEIAVQYLSGCYMPLPTSWVLHLVNATVEFGEPLHASTKAEGLGWYRHGETAQVSIPAVLPRDIFTVYVFEGWKQNGVVVSASPTYSFTVTEAVELVAVYSVKPIWDTWVGVAVTLAVAAALAVVLALAVLEAKSRKKRNKIKYR